ncbi:MAG: DUF1573 domain-containing protein [Lacipirellulaceae bacterium]
MKLLPLVIGSALLGSSVGGALAYVDAGGAEGRFAPANSIDDVPSTGPQAGAAQPYPEVEVDQPEFNFGTMQRGATETHEFVFKNTGDAPLSLKVGQTSCKCTLGQVSSAPLAPGASVPVKLEWSAKVAAGEFRQTATILTNDPRKPRVDLMVNGTVTDATGIVPADFLLGEFTTDDERTASIEIGAYKETPIEVTATMAEGTPRAELFQLSVEPVAKDQSKVQGATSAARVTVRVAPGLPLGHLTEWVVLKTNLPEAPQVQVPILGVVEGDISLHGRGWNKSLGLLNFGTFAGGEGATSNLIVSFKGEHAEGATLSVAKSDPDWVRAEVGEAKQVAPGKTHVPLRVWIPSGRPPLLMVDSGQGTGDGRVVLRTNHPKTPEVEIRIRAIITQ